VLFIISIHSLYESCSYKEAIVNPIWVVYDNGTSCFAQDMYTLDLVHLLPSV